MEAYLLFWVALSVIPAVIASGKGRSGFGWFLIGLVISPVLAAIIVAVLSSPDDELRRHRELVHAASRPVVAAAPPPVVAAAPPQSTIAPRDDPIATVGRLADLRDKGAITAEEYEAKKTELLARI